MNFQTLWSTILLSCISVCAFATDPVSVCSGISYSEATPVTAQVHAAGTHFRADDGRYVLLRGINATGNAKLPPFKTLTSPALLDPLASWGINTIRFLFTWEAFEPTPCDFSEDYLAYYEQAVKWAAERGIYVIADFHQDAFSRYALNGCGEGAPEWALTGMVTPAVPNNGLVACADWGSKAAFTPQNYLVFDRFFKDDKQALSHYLEMVSRVASRLSKYPNVIGYDMLNEPWSNATSLNPFYAMVGATIRKKHPSAMLFFEPELPVVGIMFPVSLSAVIKPPFSNIVLAPHFYSIELFTFKAWFGESPGLVLSQWKSRTGAWNIPLLLGEFGVSPLFANASGYMDAQYQWLDQNFVSGTQWSYNPGWTPQGRDGWNDEDMSINDDKLQLRSSVFKPRPYPQKTAGLPHRFEPLPSGFVYEWKNDPSLGNGKTEFYIPEGYAIGKTWKTLPESAHVTCSLISIHQAVCESNYRGLVRVTLR